MRFIAVIARKKDLKPGRLLRANCQGKLICARTKSQAWFVFVRYVDGLRAEVSMYRTGSLQ